LGEKRKVRVRPVPHLSLQSNEKTILDEVDALLLRRISETNSLTEAAKMLGISYRNAWDRIKKVESRTGKRILITRIGGADGGSSVLTPEGMSLFREYRNVRKYLFNALDDRESAGNVRYKLTARNMVGASITKIERGDIISLVRMASTGPVKLTSIISNEAVDDLRLSEGDRVEAVIKSTEVMIAKPFAPSHEKKTKSTG
jgi:molybdate transport system regulatory protein